MMSIKLPEALTKDEVFEKLDKFHGMDIDYLEQLSGLIEDELVEEGSEPWLALVAEVESILMFYEEWYDLRVGK